MSEHGWSIDDRVTVCPNGRESDRTYGTVVAVDDRGVRIELDEPVRGTKDCYASHDEPTLVKRGGGS